MGIIFVEKGKMNVFVKSHDFEDESKLQDKIEENPNILPLKAANENKLMTINKEAENDAGSADLVLTDDEGKIYLIETKLKRNTDKRRVLAQLIDYAANFSSKNYQEFISDVKNYFKNKKQDFHEEIEKKYGPEGNVLENLQHHFENHEFILVIAMDKVDEDIEKMINFINTHKFWTYGYDVERYKVSENQEVLVPRLIGSETVEQTSGQIRKAWSEKEFLDYLEKQPTEVKKSVKELFDFSRDELGPYRPRIASSPAFRITHKMLGIKSYGEGKNPDNVLLQVGADGTIYTRSDYFINKDGRYSCPAAEHFYKEMQKLLGNEIFEKWGTTWEYLPFEKWGNKTQRIKEILREVVAIGKQKG